MVEGGIGSGFRENLKKLRTRIIKKNAAVFGFFLLLSSLFWYLNALSKEMVVQVDYPVRYINFPADKALLNELPQELALYLEGPGYSILQSRLKANKPPLVIDVSTIGKTVTEDRDKYSFFVLTYVWGDMLGRQMRGDFRVGSISPDTIFFEFDRQVSRKVPVIADLEVNTMKQFMVYGAITCDPDSVEISGPRALIDTIPGVKTRFQKFVQMNQTFADNIALEPIRKVSISAKKVEVTIPVEQYTEAVFVLPVVILNEPDSVRVRIFPDRVNLQCIVALRDYKKIEEAPIEAVIDMKQVDPRITSKLSVQLRNLPEYAGGLKYFPDQVEYILEKK